MNLIHMKNSRIAILIVGLLLAGCASNKTPKPTLQRGWIGGQYKLAKNKRSLSESLFGNDYSTIYTFPPAVGLPQKAGVLVKRLETNTPAYHAGLREGDLILQAGHEPSTDLPQFWGLIASQTPGATLPLTIYRAGQLRDLKITVGREKYQKGGSITVGLPGYWYGLHAVPTHEAPWFSLGPVGVEKGTDSPPNLNTVESRYTHEAHPKSGWERDVEEWKIWVALVELKKSEKILAQETVEK